MRQRYTEQVQLISTGQYGSVLVALPKPLPLPQRLGPRMQWLEQILQCHSMAGNAFRSRDHVKQNRMVLPSFTPRYARRVD